MIKINKNDSIVDIMLKMKSEKKQDIILDFPFGHPVLHNYTSLKILKTKAGKQNLIISTNDKTSKKIGKKLGIKYSMTSNPDVIGHNYNFWEFLVYTVKNYITEIKQTILGKSKDSSFGKYQKMYTNAKMGFFIGFLILSTLLLFLVFYFAVNKTYVYIRPEIEVKTRGKNFIFKEMGDEDSVVDDRIIKLKKIEKIVNLKDTFGTSGIKGESISSAKGKVTLYNLMEEDVTLIKNTRLQTDDGLVFLLQNQVKIPKADTSGVKVVPGNIEVDVIARTKDAKGNIIGKKGNIKAKTRFFIPGLKKNKNKIYALNSKSFGGGKDNFIKILSKEDIENAKKILEAKLQKKALEEVKTDIKNENKINDISYSIFSAKETIQYRDFKVATTDDLEVGKQRETFEMFGTIKISLYTYNRDILTGKLETTINQNILTEVEKILNIDKKSIEIVHELNRKYKNKKLELKATVEADVFFAQNFLSKKNNYVERLKHTIVGKNKEDARKILENTKEISNAEIKIRPFFINNVSMLIENIEFIVQEK